MAQVRAGEAGAQVRTGEAGAHVSTRSGQHRGRDLRDTRPVADDLRQGLADDG